MINVTWVMAFKWYGACFPGPYQGLIRTQFSRLLSNVSVATLILFFEGIVQVSGDLWRY